MTLSSFEEAKARKVERDARFSALEPFEQLRALYPHPNGIELNTQTARLKFTRLTNADGMGGLTTRVRDRTNDNLDVVRYTIQDPAKLVEAARKFSTKIAEARQRNPRLWVPDLAQWLNDGIWQDYL